MQPSDLPAPRQAFVITHVLAVSDQDRSRQWYVDVLGLVDEDA